MPSSSKKVVQGFLLVAARILPAPGLRRGSGELGGGEDSSTLPPAPTKEIRVSLLLVLLLLLLGLVVVGGGTEEDAPLLLPHAYWLGELGEEPCLGEEAKVTEGTRVKAALFRAGEVDLGAENAVAVARAAVDEPPGGEEEEEE